MVIVFMGLVVLGLVVLQNYVYNKLWDKGLSLDIRFSSKEAFEGDALYLHEELTNNKLLPLPWVFVKFSVSQNLIFEGDDRKTTSDAHYQSDLFTIKMFQKIKRKMPFVCAKRGYYRLRKINMTCSNLLHNRRFDKKLANASELTVFPRLIDDNVDINLIYKNLDATMLSNSLINPDPFEFRGIREYQPTDPMRDINFKASAVAQQLMVNIHAPTCAKRLKIILNTEYNRKYPEFELYEQAIRLAATMTDKYINQGVNLSFYTNGKDVASGDDITINSGEGRGHMHKIFQALARISLNFKASNISNYLKNQQNNGQNPVYFIISPYNEPDFLDAIEDMKNRGLSVFVVVPIQKGIDTANFTQTETMRIWEAM